MSATIPEPATLQAVTTKEGAIELLRQCRPGSTFAVDESLWLHDGTREERLFAVSIFIGEACVVSGSKKTWAEALENALAKAQGHDPLAHAERALRDAGYTVSSPTTPSASA